LVLSDLTTKSQHWLDKSWHKFQMKTDLWIPTTENTFVNFGILFSPF
jgi:hypothetical protein